MLDQHLALMPTLGDGQVVMDNLSSHKGDRVKELIEGRGCELIYLPPDETEWMISEALFRAWPVRYRAPNL